MTASSRSVENTRISVVVPILDEASVIHELRRRLESALEKLNPDFEVIFVDDGSTDGTSELADRICNEDPRFCCVHLSRNFGHQAAVTAGLFYASNEITCVMDGDLQDPPEMLEALVAEWEKGSDVVYAIRESRKEHWSRVVLYDLFYRLLARISAVDIPLDAGDFCLMSRSVVNEMNLLPERERFVRGLRTWVGFKQTGVRYERDSRAAGESKYNLFRLVQLAISGFVSFSDKPLLYVMFIGLIISAAALTYAAFLIAYALVFGGMITGYASMMTSMLLLGGLQLTAMGVVGIYVSTIFKEVKGRPTFIVSSLRGIEPRGFVPARGPAGEVG